jgi:hypothetical protein
MIRVLRRLAAAIVLAVVSVPPLAHAQVNIDAGKTPAHIFSSDCAVCHKSSRGLAKGMSGAQLGAFLSEHYTSDSQEAAAMAAYVLAGGGAEPSAAVDQTRKKPGQEHAAAPAAEPKNPVREARRPAKPEAAASLGEQGPPAGRQAQPARAAARELARPETRRPALHPTADRHERETRMPATASAARHPPRESELEFAPRAGAAAKPLAPRDNIPD